MRKSLIAFTFFVLGGVLCWVAPLTAQEAPQGTAQDLERPVAADSPVYGWLADLFASQGQTLPTRFAPSTIRQVLWELSLLDSSQFDRGQAQLASAIRTTILGRPQTYHEGAFSARITQDFNPQGFASLGTLLPWYDGYNTRPNLYDIKLEASVGNWVWAGFDLDLKKDYFTDLDQLQPVSNIPLSGSELEWMWPDTAGMVFGGDHWDVRFLRGKVGTQAGFTNAALSTSLGTVDQLGFSTWWKGFTYNFLVIPFSDYAITPGQTYYGGYYKTTPLDQQASANNNNGATYMPASTTYFIDHRLDFRLFSRLNLTVSEILLVDMSSFDPQYFNPFFPGHNWLLQSNANSDIALDLDWAAAPGWNLYGQIYGDYIRTAFKSAEFGDANPLAMAYLAGLRRVWTVGDTVWSFQTEGTYADPFLYLNPDVNAVYYQRYQTTYQGSGGEGIFLVGRPFGLAAGPDSITAVVSLKAENPRRWKLSLTAPFTAQGDNSIYTPAPTLKTDPWTNTTNPLYGTTGYLSWVSPTGTAVLTQQVILTAEAGPDLLQGTLLAPGGSESSLSLSLDWATVWNQNHIISAPVSDLQTVLTWKNRW
ncbi:MAG: hypothetical protein HKM05_02345 [Spirochaetales bacterium]|nr:hypothetical protein [Spirochaetales bacterium]